MTKHGGRRSWRHDQAVRSEEIRRHGPNEVRPQQLGQVGEVVDRVRPFSAAQRPQVRCQAIGVDAGVRVGGMCIAMVAPR